MHKRERLENAIAGEAVDHIPAALWRPFPGDDQRAADLASCIIDFQRQYDWDFINVIPASNYAVIDYGLQDEWQGAADGHRITLKSPIKRSLDWTELRALDPERGELGKQLECLRLVLDAARADQTPVLIAVYSPLAQASRLAGRKQFIRHLRTHGDRLRTGLNILTESTLRFIEALKVLSVDGIYYVIEHADHDLFSESEYDLVGLPYDRKILDTLPASMWFNIIYLRGEAPMFRYASSLRAQGINWSAHQPDLSILKTQFSGALCGGLDVEHHLRQGTPAIIRDAARDIFNEMNSRRLILTGGGSALATTPFSNFRAVRTAVEGTRV